MLYISFTTAPKIFEYLKLSPPPLYISAKVLNFIHRASKKLENKLSC